MDRLHLNEVFKLQKNLKFKNILELGAQNSEY
jgi:hypothetical protein